MINNIKHVVKRDGSTADFNPNNIVQAVMKASDRSTDSIGLPEAMRVTDKVTARLYDGITVEEIQDIVEEVLMSYRYYDTARKYICYRMKRAEERDNSSRLMRFVSDVIDLSNVENENANMPEWVFTAKNVRMSAELSKKYAREFLLRPNVRKAFDDMAIYLHDFSQYAVGSHNCLTLDLEDILSRGFVASNGDVRPPTTIRSAMQLTAVILQCQSNVQFGGIAVGTLDSDLAPYVRRSFRKHFKTATKYLASALSDTVVVNHSDMRIENEALQTAYPELYQYAYDQTVEEVYQSAEAFIHNLNTLQSRAGDQLPFTSVNFGLDTSPEGRLITRALLESSIKGIGKHNSTSIFPIMIFQYKKGVNDVAGTPNYDLKQLAIECLSKRIYPNFVNADEVDFTMGCRTMTGKDRHGLPNGKSRGNISPVTINLTKMGLDNGIAVTGAEHPDLEGFWNQLEETVDLAVTALVDRFEWQGKQLAKSAPFCYENELMKGDRKLEPNEPVRDVLKHGTLAIGYLGVSNMCSALFGKDHSEDLDVLDFAEDVVAFIREKADEASIVHDLNFSAYATPAEGLCHKMMKSLQEQYGIVDGVTDRDYVNNSHHVPVYRPISIQEKIDIEARFAQYANGGNITYVELDGNARQNLTAIEDIIDYAMQAGCTYVAINHPIDCCTECGYEGIIGDTCPKCGGIDGEVYIKRLRRVTGYLTSSYREYFNAGKKAETDDRYVHSQHSNLHELTDLC